MRYTRFDLKRNKGKRSGKSILTFISALIILGAVSWTLLFSINIKDLTGSSAGSKSNSKNVNFTAIQGGMYAKDENVEKEKSALSSYGTPFVVKQGEVSRVFSGIYLEENYQLVIDAMNKNSKTNSKMVFKLNKNDLCDTEIAEIITANIKILNKLSENGVKGVQTKDYKAWVTALKKPDSNSKNIEVIKQLEDYVQKMPDTVTRDMAPDNYVFLYNILKNISEISK
ncbi:MAG: hypothetical protein ACM3X7_13340 [Solirubrobacterales bacterium]